MPSDLARGLEALAELHRRGALTPEQDAIYKELARRNLAPKEKVGPAESAARQFVHSLGETGIDVAKALTVGPAAIGDRIRALWDPDRTATVAETLIEGKGVEPRAADFVSEKIEPAVSAAENALNETAGFQGHEQPSVVGQVVGELGTYLAPGIPLAKGVKVAEGAGRAARFATQGLAGITPFATQYPIQRDVALAEQGADPGEIARAHTVNALTSLVMGLIPVSARGGVATRALTGGALNLGLGEAQVAAERAAIGKRADEVGALEQLDPERMGMEAALGAALGALLGGRAPRTGGKAGTKGAKVAEDIEELAAREGEVIPGERPQEGAPGHEGVTIEGVPENRITHQPPLLEAPVRGLPAPEEARPSGPQTTTKGLPAPEVAPAGPPERGLPAPEKTEPPGHQAPAGPEVLSFEEFLASRGVSSTPPSEPGLHRTPGGMSKPAKRAAMKRLEERFAAWQQSVDKARDEYDRLIAEGRIREPTPLEILERTAQGHPDRASTQAARRLLAKRKARMEAMKRQKKRMSSEEASRRAHEIVVAEWPTQGYERPAFAQHALTELYLSPHPMTVKDIIDSARRRKQSWAQPMKRSERGRAVPAALRAMEERGIVRKFWDKNGEVYYQPADRPTPDWAITDPHYWDEAAKRERQPETEKPEVKPDRSKAARERYRQQATVDPEKDDILAAIAKLGGWSRDEAQAQGIDPAEFGRRGWRIKRVFTKGGDTADGLAERLAQYGYPVTDEHGNYDANRLLDAVDRALRGEKVSTARGVEHELEAQAAEREAYEPVFEDEVYQALDIEEPREARLFDAARLAEEHGVPEEVVEDILERAAVQDWDDARIEKAIEDARRAQGEERAAEGQGKEAGEVLSTYTEEDIAARERARQEAEERARQEELKAEADRMREDFRLTGSDREVDELAARGQRPLLRRSSEKLAAKRAPVLRREAQALVRRWPGAPKINVVHRVSDLPRDVPDDTAGMLHDGEVFIVAENVRSRSELHRTVFHETFGHAGVIGWLMEHYGDWRRFMRQVAKSMPEEVARVRKRLGLDSDEVAAAEYIAELAEKAHTLKGRARLLLSRAIAMVRDALRKAGFRLKLSDDDLRALISKGMGRFRSRGGKVKGPSWLARAYHGSPHKFDKFSLDRIGTGEGAQAYGWGLYFAENPDVAGHYAAALVDDVEGRFTYVLGDGARGREFRFADEAARHIVGDGPESEVSGALAALDDLDEILAGKLEIDPEIEKEARTNPFTRGYLKVERLIRSGKLRREERTGNLYEVDIPDEAIARMLDWDKPLSEQPDAVKKALRKLPDWVRKDLDEFRELHGQEPEGWSLYRILEQWRGPQAASELLRRNGIHGIRYLDATSRGVGDGTRNIVLFDDSLVKIKTRNGKPVSFDDAMQQQEETFLRRAPEDAEAEAHASMSERWERFVHPYWEKAARKVSGLLRRVKLADDAPPEFKRALRKMRAEIAASAEKVSGLVREAMELPREEREMISDYIEGELQAGVEPPEHVVRIAQAMIALNERMADELVRLGWLSAESRERLRGRYLHRYYAKRLLRNPFDMALRKLHRSVMQGVSGSYLKGRGIFRWVPKGMEGEYLDRGWEVRGQKKNAVLVWRDLTRAEREKLGEVRDAGYRFIRGYLEATRDVAIGRLFEKMLRDGIARDAPMGEDWVQVPKTEAAPGVYRYGAIAGKWVPPDVLDHLEPIQGERGELARAYLKALSLWKEGKTALNPVVHSNNIAATIVMADLAGVHPWNVKAYAQALSEYLNKGEYYLEAKDAGLFGTEFFAAELRELVPELSELKSAELMAAGWIGKAVDYMARYSGARTYREKMGRLYQAEDQFFKMLLYIDARKRGMGVDEAVDWANKWIFDYTDIPKGVRVIKATALPFFTYTYKAIPAVAYAAVHHPVRFIKWAALFGGYNWLAYQALFGEGAEERERAERSVLPEYMKGFTLFPGVPKSMRLASNDETGEALFLDLSRRMVLGDLFDAANQWGGIPILQPFMPNNPVLTIMQAVMFNIDTFTGREVVPTYVKGWERYEKIGRHILMQLIPNTPLLPGSYSWSKVMSGLAGSLGRPIEVPGFGEFTGQDYYGRRQTLGRALAATVLGHKVRSVDVKREFRRRIFELRRQERELQADRRSLVRNKGIGERERKQRLEELKRRLVEIRREQQQLVEKARPALQ